MEGQETDNQTQASGTPDNNGADNSIVNIMGGMTTGNTPESKPNNGDKGEGEGTSSKESSNETPAWMQQLPEEMRNDANLVKQLSKFQKIGDVAKSYSELEAKLGKSLIQPGEGASEEEVNAFYEKLGKPKSAKDYQIPEGNDAFKELAYKNNLSNAQAVALFEQFKSVGERMLQQQQVNLQQQAQATTAKLKAEFGNNFNTKMEMLKRGVMTYGGAELGNLLKEKGLLANETIVRTFINLGEMSAEAGTSNKASQTADSYKRTEEGGKFEFIENMFKEKK